MKRARLLDLLCHRFPEDERKTLHARILCGEIAVNGTTERDPKRTVSLDSDIEWKGSSYVGRGAHKLTAAIEAFRPPLDDAIVLDAGSSTGGFTESLLEHGARQVYAVDVGTNQLAWKLRSDTRVTAMEGRNILDVSIADLDPVPDFAVCDLSFRSLSGVSFHIASLTRLRRVIALAKPQFERAGFVRFNAQAGHADSGVSATIASSRGRPDSQNGGRSSSQKRRRATNEKDQGFSGVVTDAEGEAVVKDLKNRLRDEGLICRGMCRSPIRGRRGNREYFLDLEIA